VGSHGMWLLGGTGSIGSRGVLGGAGGMGIIGAGYINVSGGVLDGAGGTRIIGAGYVVRGILGGIFGCLVVH
jgi:hypothetical protein